MENKENRFTENAELSDDELDSVSGGADTSALKLKQQNITLKGNGTINVVNDVVNDVVNIDLPKTGVSVVTGLTSEQQIAKDWMNNALHNPTEIKIDGNLILN